MPAYHLNETDSVRIDSRFEISNIQKTVWMITSKTIPLELLLSTRYTFSRILTIKEWELAIKQIVTSTIHPLCDRCNYLSNASTSVWIMTCRCNISEQRLAYIVLITTWCCNTMTDRKTLHSEVIKKVPSWAHAVRNIAQNNWTPALSTFEYVYYYYWKCSDFLYSILC